MCSLLTLRTYTYRHIDRFQYVNIFVHMPDIFMYMHFVSIWSTSITFIWSTWIKMYVNRDTPEYVYQIHQNYINMVFYRKYIDVNARVCFQTYILLYFLHIRSYTGIFDPYTQVYAYIVHISVRFSTCIYITFMFMYTACMYMCMVVNVSLIYMLIISFINMCIYE